MTDILDEEQGFRYKNERLNLV